MGRHLLRSLKEGVLVKVPYLKVSARKVHSQPTRRRKSSPRDTCAQSGFDANTIGIGHGVNSACSESRHALKSPLTDLKPDIRTESTAKDTDVLIQGSNLPAHDHHIAQSNTPDRRITDANIKAQSRLMSPIEVKDLLLLALLALSRSLTLTALNDLRFRTPGLSRSATLRGLALLTGRFTPFLGLLLGPTLHRGLGQSRRRKEAPYQKDRQK